MQKIITPFLLAIPAVVFAYPGNEVNAVKDQSDIKNTLKGYSIKFDKIFTPTNHQIELPKANLRAYLEIEIRNEKNESRANELKSILHRITTYIWYVAGFEKNGEQFLFCYFFKDFETGFPKLSSSRFPMIRDGGTSVCQAVFQLKTNQFINLRWNGEA